MVAFLGKSCTSRTVDVHGDLDVQDLKGQVVTTAGASWSVSAVSKISDTQLQARSKTPMQHLTVGLPVCSEYRVM